MGKLTDLEGVKHDLDCEFFASSKEAFSILQKGLAATCADSNGAINVWIDDNNYYRCSLHKNLTTLQSFRSLKWDAVKTLLNQWLKIIK